MLVLRTLSKSFSLAGLRVGLAVGHPELLAGLRTVKDSYNLNRLTQAAAVAALADMATMRANVARIRADPRRAHGGLERPGLRRPAVTRELRAGPPARSRPGPVAAALAERGVLVRHFTRPGLRDALRITVGTDAECDVLLRALVAVV